MSDQPRISPILRLLVPFGLAVAALRYALEWWAPAQAFFVGVYFLMPIAVAYAVSRGAFDRVDWKRALGLLCIVAFAAWTLPNMISYVTAQFQGWQHGRFAPDRAPRLQETTFDKITAGVGLGAITTLPGLLWLVAFAAIFQWVRRRLLARADSRPRGPA